jgi:hypothetical protein
MKTLRRAIAVGMVAAFATVAFAVQAPADHTEPRFTLEIDPSQGLPGQTIDAQVPLDDAATVCGSENDLLLALQTIINDAIAGNTPAPGSLEAVLQAILSGAVGELTPEDLENFAFLFVLLFVDPATQEPLSNPGEDFWDPATGQGQIVAPGIDENPDSPNAGQVLPRPATYFVAAACLGFGEVTPEELQALLEEAVAEGAQQLIDCAPTFMDPGCQELIGALVEGIIAGLIEAAVNDDPDVAWVAPFCLLGGNGVIQTCEVPAEAVAPPPPAAPVTAVARFTG